jgi:hypothetical protein
LRDLFVPSDRRLSFALADFMTRAEVEACYFFAKELMVMVSRAYELFAFLALLAFFAYRLFLNFFTCGESGILIRGSLGVVSGTSSSFVS